MTEHIGKLRELYEFMKNQIESTTGEERSWWARQSRHAEFLYLQASEHHYVLTGQDVKRMRKRAGLTQAELADGCGCHRTLVCLMETGRAGVTREMQAEIEAVVGNGIPLVPFEDDALDGEELRGQMRKIWCRDYAIH